eukprot:TRINITY_DN8754_c0_g1_i1.p1 TRINITY_DN8754_c0_g1~~TRINITY_DN8754_c0_g1_i1.p1  ORF type:complete len:1163 (+),score=268.54 TRINITY_DN8754_c0_g1_i1:2523-6011(+)
MFWIMVSLLTLQAPLLDHLLLVPLDILHIHTLPEHDILNQNEDVHHGPLLFLVLSTDTNQQSHHQDSPYTLLYVHQPYPDIYFPPKHRNDKLVYAMICYNMSQDLLFLFLYLRPIVAQVFSFGRKFDKGYLLFSYQPKPEQRGLIFWNPYLFDTIRIQQESKSNMSGLLRLHVIAGSELYQINKGSKKSDPFVQVWVGKKKEDNLYQTSVQKRTLEPQWGEDIEIEIEDPDSYYNKSLHIRVYHYDVWGENICLGRVDVHIGEYMDYPGDEIVDWYPLKAPKKGEAHGGHLHFGLIYHAPEGYVYEEYPEEPIVDDPVEEPVESIEKPLSKTSTSESDSSLLLGKSSSSESVDSSESSSSEDSESDGLSKRLDENALYEQYEQKLTSLKRGRTIDIPDFFVKQRTSLLQLLESRMTLREIVSEKIKQDRILEGNLSFIEIKKMLTLDAPEDEDELDIISSIQELRKEIAKQIRRNHELNTEKNRIESKIALLISNRTSVQEIDREKEKRRRDKENVGDSDHDFSTNMRIVNLYSNLFYLLQTNPKYLAKLAYLVPTKDYETFLDTLLLALYGDTFSPREEYLLMNLFKYAVGNEIKRLTEGPQEFKESSSVVIKMVMTYNKRKLGTDYLSNAFEEVHQRFYDKPNDFEMRQQHLYKKLDMDNKLQESKKKKKKKFALLIDEDDEKFSHPLVLERIQETASNIMEACDDFLNCIVSTVNIIPYGLRLICKDIFDATKKKFPKSPETEFYKVLGFFVYFKFISPCVVSPGMYGIDVGGLQMLHTTNLVTISKVLQTLFDLRNFPEEDPLSPLNEWIEDKKGIVMGYFTKLINVPPPEEYLQVDQYNEMIQTTSPLILIGMGELVNTHQLLHNYLDDLIKEEEDHLKIILDELGPPPPKLSPSLGEKKIQLTLQNRFTMTDNVNEFDELYETTIGMVISIFKSIPPPEGSKSFLGILEFAKNYGEESGKTRIVNSVEKVMENIKVLEEADYEGVTKKDRYTSFLRAVALEVANRGERRDHQKSLYSRLNTALKNLREHQRYITEQLAEFENYVEHCRANAAAKIDATKTSKPKKYSYKSLEKLGVIVDSEVPSISRPLCKFYISMKSAGHFQIEAKIGKSQIGEMALILEDLLERKESGEKNLALENVTLNIPSTLILVNTEFLS